MLIVGHIGLVPLQERTLASKEETNCLLDAELMEGQGRTVKELWRLGSLRKMEKLV